MQNLHVRCIFYCIFTVSVCDGLSIVAKFSFFANVITYELTHELLYLA